jgi:cytochrome c oxidase subunit 2
MTAIISAIGIWLTLSVDLFPVAAGREARFIDDAFILLTVLAVPVFAFVLSTLIYSVLIFRSKDDPAEDGPPSRTHGKWVAFWFVWTVALVIAVIIHPGLTGLREIRAGAGEEVDLVIEATGSQWLWQYKYPGQGLTTINEVVLPVGQNVRFDVASTDVLHSAWVPALRMKIDAVPGLVTKMYVHPEVTGSFATDYNFRMQCAELCGLSHAAMFARLRVVDGDEFEAWVASKKQ